MKLQKQPVVRWMLVACGLVWATAAAAQAPVSGVKSELVVIAGANHGVAGAGPQVVERAITFTREQLQRP